MQRPFWPCCDSFRARRLEAPSVLTQTAEPKRNPWQLPQHRTAIAVSFYHYCCFDYCTALSQQLLKGALCLMLTVFSRYRWQRTISHFLDLASTQQTVKAPQSASPTCSSTALLTCRSAFLLPASRASLLHSQQLTRQHFCRHPTTLGPQVCYLDFCQA